ncbi:hypothetical protein JCM11491_000686, partial [Sporobolomyces phaffii]
HPDLVPGSAAAGRVCAWEGLRKRAVAFNNASEDEDSHSTSGPDDDEDPSSGYLVPNGRPSGHEKSRSTSSTVHDRSKNGPNFHAHPSSSSSISAASGAIAHQTPSAAAAASRAYPASHLTSPSSPFAHHGHSAAAAYGGGGGGRVDPNNPHSAKESFLNYFFGGSDPHLAGPASVGAHPGRIVGPAGTVGSASVGGSGGHARENPLHGRKGLEGNAAAFEMKSLEKHLEPAPSLNYPGETSGLTQREEMETNLIRALIASYFSIVRQTVKDLVPKAIMHLLVNFSRESVQNRLVASLYKDSLFSELLYEDEALTAERTRIKGLLNAYREAFQTLSEVL